MHGLPLTSLSCVILTMHSSMNSKASKNTKLVGVHVQQQHTLFVSKPIGQMPHSDMKRSLRVLDNFSLTMRLCSKIHSVSGRSLFSPLRQIPSCSVCNITRTLFYSRKSELIEYLLHVRLQLSSTSEWKSRFLKNCQIFLKEIYLVL